MSGRYLLVTCKNSSSPTQEDVDLLFRELVLHRDNGKRVYAGGILDVCMGKFNRNQARAFFPDDVVLASHYLEAAKSENSPFIGRIAVENSDIDCSQQAERLRTKHPQFNFMQYILSSKSETPVTL